MTKITILLIGFTLLLANVKAQNQKIYSDEYGVVTQYEMEMDEYSDDTDAEALVLYEKGNNYFIPNHFTGRFELHMEYSIKIKILKQAGIKYAEFEIPYYVEGHRFESVDDLKGTSYNLVNSQTEKTPLNTKNIFEESYGKSVRIKKFAMPNVREGSIVEISYTIVTPFFFNMREWKFQKKIPVLNSRLLYKAIPYYEYTYIMKGANKFDEFNNEKIREEKVFGNLRYNEMQYTFGMKNVPAFKDEEFISSLNDYMMSLNFQISTTYSSTGGETKVMTTWPQLCNDYLKDSGFGKYIKGSVKEGKKILAAMDVENLPATEKIKHITQYVKSNYNWNGDNAKYASVKVSDFLKQKTGNVADINLFLTGLLQAAGFNATPVVLSTRSNGAVSLLHPFSKFLNYVIVQVSTTDTSYLIDATVSALAFDELPQRCTNVTGLVVKPKSEEWINIFQNNLALTQKEFDIRFYKPDNLIDIDTKITSHSFDAYNYRSQYRGKDENIVGYLQKNGTESISDLNVENYLDVEQPFILSFSSEQPAELIDDKLFIKPFLNQSVTNNIFKQNKRGLPIDLIYKYGGEYTSTINIPEGYQIEHLPQALNVNNILMLFDYNIEVVDNKIMVHAYYEFKHSIYDAKFYNLLKSCYSNMLNKFNEAIVLQKQ